MRPSVKQLAHAWSAAQKGSSSPTNVTDSMSHRSTPHQSTDARRHRASKNYNNKLLSTKLQEGEERQYLHTLKKLKGKLSILNEEHSELKKSRMDLIKSHHQEIGVLTTEHNNLIAEQKCLKETLLGLQSVEDQEISKWKEQVAVEKARRVVECQKKEAAVQQIVNLKADLARCKELERKRRLHIQELSNKLNTTTAQLTLTEKQKKVGSTLLDTHSELSSHDESA